MTKGMSWSACSLVSSLLLYASPTLMTQPQLAAEHGDDLLHLSDESVGIRVSNADAALSLDVIDESLEGIDSGHVVVLVHIVEGLHGDIQLGVQAVLDSLLEVERNYLRDEFLNSQRRRLHAADVFVEKVGDEEVSSTVQGRTDGKS